MLGKLIFKICLLLPLGMGFLAHASASVQLAIPDTSYVGRIWDAEPADPADEVGYINDLITLGAGAPKTLIPLVTGSPYDRIGSTIGGPFATAVLAGAVKQDNSNTVYNLPGTFQYILAKYDGPNYGDAVWYFPNGISGMIEVPATATNPDTHKAYGLSHISAYNPGGTVPEPAAFLVWGGLVFAGTWGARRQSVR